MPDWNVAAALYINRAWSGPVADAVFGWLSATWGFGLVLAIALLVCLVRRAGRDGFIAWLVLIVAVLAADAVGHAFKDWLAQPRPCHALRWLIRAPQGCAGPLTGMPSNHMATFTTAAVFFALLVRSLWAGGLLGVTAVAVGLSRIYLGKHYPSQVLAGAALGIVVAAVVYGVAFKLLAPIARTYRCRRSSCSRSIAE